jgi:cysteinyl leukotriene receptor 2
MVESDYYKQFFLKLEIIDQNLNLIYPLLIMFMGLIGNGFTIYIFSQKCFKKTSIGTYYSYLAVVDSLILILGSTRFFLEANNQINITTLSNLACKFFTSSMYILQQISGWMLAIASLDRIFLVQLPSVFVFKNIKRFKFLVMLTTTVFLIFLNIPNILFLQIVEKEIKQYNKSIKNIKYCELTDKHFFNNNVGDILDLLLFAIIPFLGMLISSIIISRVIFFSKRNFYRSNKKKNKRDYQFAITILTMNFLFLILNLPICIHLLIRNWTDESNREYNERILYNIVYTFSNILSYLNFSNSIFVNLALNHLFRKEFKKIFYKQRKETN